jgi:hypothetical protein
MAVAAGREVLAAAPRAANAVWLCVLLLVAGAPRSAARARAST